MRKFDLLAVCFLWIFAFTSTTLKAQTGDQILDGIGETGLIARYIFKDDVRDWSRNNLHGTIHGSDIGFVEDNLFGKVLSLPGSGDSYISIPAEAVSVEESLSLVGWVFMQSPERGQVFFDFGKSGESHVFSAPLGNKENDGFLNEIRIKSGVWQTQAQAVAAFRWSHIGMVIDVPGKTLSTYLNGELVGKVKDLDFELKDIFVGETDEKGKFFIGQTLDSALTELTAKLHDFRIYRIPLSQEQITTIARNAFRNEDAVVRTRRERNRDLPKFPDTAPQLYTVWLTNVQDIQVETTIGRLPKLPRYLTGTYSNHMNGPLVRVLWPSPEDNRQVLQAGSYKITGKIAGSDIRPQAKIIVKKDGEVNAPERTLEVFDLDQVTLNPDIRGEKTKFQENREKFMTGLANTNPDNFLYMFRNAFGQPQPEGAEPLHGWDSQETKLRGHATGHYLSGIAQAYASAGYDKELRQNFAEKMVYVVDALYELSQLSGKPKLPNGEFVSDPLAVPPGLGKSDFESDLSKDGIRTDYWNWGEGFISAYPPDQFIMLENGAKYGTDSSKIWAPYYTLHKILAGLMDVYEVSGNEKALEIVKGMGDWVYARLSQVPTPTLINMWNRYIAGEFGGMNEAMARLYRLTNDQHYLKLAQLFDNIRVFFGDADHSHGLAKNVDMFRGLHANQHIPQIMGALEIYRVSEKPDYFYIADNFWNKVTNDYMYSIGGVAGARNPANAECFTGEPASLYENGFSAGGQNETCATYNMLKLTRNLFLFDQRSELMDYYERGLYNHILASVDEYSPANTYHVPLRAGSVKHFGNEHMSGFTCCNGTALENSTKLQNSIYFKSADNQDLFVNLFIPSTLDWSAREITVTQETAFPKNEVTKLTILGQGKFDLHVRVPHWATKGFFVQINGKEQIVETEPGSYLTISRKWKHGDTVELRIPFTFHLEPVMDQQNVASLFYGPVLLAAQEPEPRKEWRKVRLNARDLSQSISGDPEELVFTIDGVKYKPFYDTYGRHSVYLDVTLIDE